MHAYYSLPTGGARTQAPKNNYNKFILKFGSYVEMQIFGRLLRVEHTPARIGASQDMIYEPACRLWQALLFYAMIDGSISRCCKCKWNQARHPHGITHTDRSNFPLGELSCIDAPDLIKLPLK